jgi:hypothetical protein
VTRSLRVLGPLAAFLALSSCRLERAPAGHPGGGYAVEPDSVASAEVYAALHAYYTTLSSRDWRRVGAHFLPHGTITDLMAMPGDSARGPRTLGVEEFVARAGRTRALGLIDEPMHASIVTYGPLADAWVTYRSRVRVRKDSTVTQFGVDAFHLMKVGGRWRIAGLAFQNEIRGQPIVSESARR